jgi:hypothetical protein
MFVYRLFGPMGDDLGQVDLSIPTVEPGVTVTTGEGGVVKVLDVVEELEETSPFRALLVVEQVA